MLNYLATYANVIAIVILAVWAYFALAWNIDILFRAVGDLKAFCQKGHDHIDSHLDSISSRFQEVEEDIEYLEGEIANMYPDSDKKDNPAGFKIVQDRLDKLEKNQRLVVNQWIGFAYDLYRLNKSQSLATANKFPGLLLIPNMPLTVESLQRLRDQLINRRAEEVMCFDGFDVYHVVDGRWKLMAKTATAQCHTCVPTPEDCDASAGCESPQEKGSKPE